MPINLKSAREIAVMQQAGRVVATVLAEIEEKLAPGQTTKRVDEIAERTVARLGAKASFKGLYGFPASICISINEEIVHGIPSPGRVLKEGDIVSLDFGAYLDGLHADAAVTLPVGKVSEEARRLLSCCRTALERGIAQARPGKRLGDISWAIQSYGEAKGYGIVRQYVGHGVGRTLHEEPQVPNVGQPGRGVALRPGMTLAIEPMLNVGTEKTAVLDDKWTVVTEDRKLSAHFEHTVAITEGEPLVLTRLA
ncbi:MAG TPA: type I methionyl aminopeptidase [Chloroflexota bacterium]|jgi:methionyl aminopeptidase|nr:type I methionyl aminopeptidase [Chloroflexota bacterium]